MPRLYLCFKLVFNSKNNDWVLPTLILLLLQPIWKRGKNLSNILPADRRSTSNTYPEQSQLSVEQSSSKRSESDFIPVSYSSFALLHFLPSGWGINKYASTLNVRWYRLLSWSQLVRYLWHDSSYEASDTWVAGRRGSNNLVFCFRWGHRT